MSFIDWLNGKWGTKSEKVHTELAVQLECATKCPVEVLPVQQHLGPLFDVSPLNKSYDPIFPPPFRLKYLIEKLNGRRSSYDAPHNEVSEVEYYRTLHKAAATSDENMYGAISSCIDISNHVMTLDCDSTDEMLAVCHVLKSYYGLNYAVVISSPNHYWVIADKCDSTSELLKMMEIIPGIDSRYVDCIRNRREIVLRGMPKDSMPTFPDSVEFKDERVATWYKAFKDTWNSEEMKHILRLKQLVKAIKEKKVAELAASPSFAI